MLNVIEIVFMYRHTILFSKCIKAMSTYISCCQEFGCGRETFIMHESGLANGQIMSRPIVLNCIDYQNADKTINNFTHYNTEIFIQTVTSGVLLPKNYFTVFKDNKSIDQLN